MQKKGNDFRSLDICHRIFNFIINSLTGIGLKRVTLGHPMPQGSTNEGQLDEYPRNEVQEPLITQAKLNGEERGNSKLVDDSDSVVQILFKQTEEELDYWNRTHVDKLGSSSRVAEKDDDDEVMEKRSEFIDNDPSRSKEIPLLNGVSLDMDKPQVHGKTGQKIIIPIRDATKPMLTGLGLNINEISETFIQNTKERLSRNVSLMEEPAES